MKMNITQRIRREQICSRCRNHGKISVLKSHKKYCPYLNCNCEKCSETRDRQQFIAKEIRFHRKKQKSVNVGKNIENWTRKILSTKIIDDNNSSISTVCEVRRHQMCARCRNHDQYNPIKGHKNNCAFAYCRCEKCRITEKRRKIMAKQIRENRINKITSDDDDSFSITPTNSSETENEGFKYPQVAEEQSLPQIERIEIVEESSNEATSNDNEMFYIVQSLYEKCFMQADPKSKFELLYAFVALSQGKWEIINKSMSQGSQIADETVEKHLKMAKFHQYLLSKSHSSWILPFTSTVMKENLNYQQQQLNYHLQQQQQQPHHHQQQLWLRAMGGNF